MRHYMVDRIVEFRRGERAVGVKAISLSDEVFNEHFPGNPVYPGVYLLEGLAQTGGLLLERSTGGERFALMVSVDRARFTAFARPGDLVSLTVDVESLEPALARVRGSAAVGGRTIASARITFRLLPYEQVMPADALPFWERAKAIWAGEFPAPPAPADDA
jgi:3-hydroxyacyl-[acyl-carrier-protein] dehydratase